MKVVITGGAGFLGQRLARKILADRRISLPSGTVVESPELVLIDIPGSRIAADLLPKVTFLETDITDGAAIGRIIDNNVGAIFHLAGVVSALAEKDFELGMRVNVDGALAVLESARATDSFLPVISTSSLAVFGGNVPAVLDEATPTQPKSSYGAQKAILEILASDYRRKRFCDARTLRLPTIVVRPGKPNAAASSFASSIIREPLHGQNAICPVPTDLKLWVASPEAAVSGLLHALSLHSNRWPAFSALNLPGVTVSVQDMLHALAETAGDEALRRIEFADDSGVRQIVESWPSQFDVRLADSLGFVRDASIAAIIAAYIEANLADRGSSLTG